MTGPALQSTIRNLQVLRAVAAFMVVAHHFFEYPKRYVANWPVIEVGAAGVDVFFVISGIVMALTTARDDVDPLNFLARRAARIVPIYWLFTTFVFILLVVGFEPLGIHGWTGFQVIASYLFLPNSDGPPILVVGWTLNFEMFFYAAVAASLFIRSQATRAVVLIGGMCALAAIGFGVGVPQGQPSSYVELMFSSLLLEFAAGFALGLAYLRLNGLDTAQALAAPLGAAAFAVGVAGFVMAGTADTMPVEWRAVVFGLPAVAVCAGALLLERAGFAASSRPLLFLGDASYAVYLAHPLVGQVVEKVSTRLLPQTPATVIAALAAALIIVIVVAAAVHLLFEKPLQTRSRALLAAIRLRPRSGVGVGHASTVRT